jgi:hypothetical protein
VDCVILVCLECNQPQWSCEVYSSTIRKKKATCVCKPCHKRKYREAGERRGDLRERNWRNRGIEFTQAEYDIMLAEQDGKCAGCNGECSTGRALCLDHDHATGRVRGLLCFNCNSLLGKVKDDPLHLMRLASYLVARNGG